MRILFAKPTLLWPRATGHDINIFYLMRACSALGHEVSLATAIEPKPEAVEGLPLTSLISLQRMTDHATPVRLTRLQARFGSYYGGTPGHFCALAWGAGTKRADAVVV